MFTTGLGKSVALSESSIARAKSILAGSGIEFPLDLVSVIWVLDFTTQDAQIGLSPLLEKSCFHHGYVHVYNFKVFFGLLQLTF